MMKTFVRAAFAASLLASAATAALMLPVTAHAADDAQDKDKTEEPAVSKKVGIVLYEASKLMKDGNTADALAKVKEAEQIPDLTPWDTYKIDSFEGYLAMSLNDNAAAMQAYEAMANSPLQPAKDKAANYTNVFVLAQKLQDYGKVTKYGPMLNDLQPLDNVGLAIISQAFYLNHDVPNATIWAKKSVAKAKEENKSANTFVLQLVLNEEAKTDQSAALKTLEEIAATETSPNIYYQLTAQGLQMPHITDLDGLYFYRLRFMAGGMRSADDYTIMANIAYQKGYPEEAKDVLEQGINAGKVAPGHSEAGGLLAKAKAAAATDAHSLPSAAALRKMPGNEEVTVAEDYWGYGRYADAVAAAREALSKDHLKDSSEAHMILGISLVALGKNAEALDPLSKVDGSTTRARAAYLWTLFAKARDRQVHQANVAPGEPARASQSEDKQAAPPAQQ